MGVNIMQHPSQGAQIKVLILHVYIVLPLQLIRVPELCEYLAHHVLGQMDGSQELVNGALGDSEPSGLTKLAQRIPSTTLTLTILCP